jgi:hypothetical protein
MHKEVPPPRSWRPLVIRHQAFVARVYVSADKQTLSSKSCIQRPGMHDMGAISGYRSSRATSNLTTGSASNASYGTAANEEQQQQQQDDEAGSRPQVQKGNAPGGEAVAAAGGDVAQQQANGVKQEHQQGANGLKQEQPESPMLIDGQQRQQQADGMQHGQQQQLKEEQQQQDSDEMLIMAPAPAQQEQPFISSAVAAVSGAGLLVHGVPTAAAAPMDTS